MLKRLKNPFFWSGVAGLLWTMVLSKHNWISNEDFKTVVDLVAYFGLGTGIYASFPSKEKDEDEGGE